MDRFERISVRDKKSKDLLEYISKKNIELTGDSALLIDPPEETFVKRILKKSSLDDKIPYIIIAPRSLSTKNKFFYHDYLDDFQINEIRCSLAKTADKIIESGINVVFLPMQKKYNDDRYEINKISNLMKNKAYTIFEPSSPYEVMAAISQSKMVVGLRLHSLILGTLCNVPVLSIPYDEKILGFMESVNKIECLVKPCNLPLKSLQIIDEDKFI